MNIKSLIPFGFGSMPARRTDPFGDLRREMDRLFDDFTRGWSLPDMPGAGFLNPRVDVVETDAGLEMTAELPGIDRKDIALDVTDGVLTLKAERRAEKDEKDEAKTYHLVERTSGTYLRRLPLPFAAVEDEIEATFDKGVLKVVVPRAVEAEKPVRTIEVKAA